MCTVRVGWAFTFATAAYNLIRLPKLLAMAPRRRRGEMVFGALQAGIECETAVSTIFFDCEGSDEMTPIRSTGTAELAENGSLEIEISIHYGDEIQIKAHRW